MRALQRWQLVFGLGAGLGLGGCTTIERPTGPAQHEGPLGPHIEIIKPGHDTTVASGQTINFLITVTSDNGIDTIYTDAVGSSLNLPPITGAESPTTFGISVPQGAQTGGTIILRVTAVDTLRQAGDTATRFVQIQ